MTTACQPLKLRHFRPWHKLIVSHLMKCEGQPVEVCPDLHMVKGIAGKKRILSGNTGVDYVQSVCNSPDQ